MSPAPKAPGPKGQRGGAAAREAGPGEAGRGEAPRGGAATFPEPANWRGAVLASPLPNCIRAEGGTYSARRFPGGRTRPPGFPRDVLGPGNDGGTGTAFVDESPGRGGDRCSCVNVGGFPAPRATKNRATIRITGTTDISYYARAIRARGT